MSQSKKNSKSVAGNIEGVFHQSLAGWFHREDLEEGSENELTLFLNGRPFLTTIANLDRPDVQENLGYGAKSGFMFSLDTIDTTSVAELTIRHSETGYDFNGAVVTYCEGISERFEQLRDLFYPEFYRCKYGLCHLSNDDAFQDFIKDGIFSDRDPNPWFSNTYYRESYPEHFANDAVPLLCYLENEHLLKEKPSELFDPKHYLDSNPDLENIKGLFWHFSKFGKVEGRVGIKRKLPASIKDELDEMLHIEPLISTAANNLDRIVRYPHLSKATYLPKLIHARVGDNIKAVVCVPFISRGGADLISTYVFRAYQGALGKENVLMLVTDQASIDVPEWLDDGSLVICMDDECTFTDREEKILSLHICLGQIAPEKIVNINSSITWELYLRHGVQLSTVADLYAYLFCFDYNKSRHRVGYITDYLRPTLKSLKAVFFDNAHVINEIEQIYGLMESESKKLHTVYVPAAESLIPTNYDSSEKRAEILWIGRLSIQKRPDLLVKIASTMLAHEFHVYGPAGNCEYSTRIINGDFANIRYMGVYNSLNEIDFSRYKAFLNTSEWDGLPTVIIQMMAIGLPVVTSTVCGIPELVNEENSWPVGDHEDVESYVRELYRVFINRDQALSKVKIAVDDVNNIHRWNHFYKTLESLDAFTDHDSMNRINAQFADRRRAA